MTFITRARVDEKLVRIEPSCRCDATRCAHGERRERVASACDAPPANATLVPNMLFILDDRQRASAGFLTEADARLTSPVVSRQRGARYRARRTIAGRARDERGEHPDYTCAFARSGATP
jgi:hypothetical protein